MRFPLLAVFRAPERSKMERRRLLSFPSLFSRRRFVVRLLNFFTNCSRQQGNGPNATRKIGVFFSLSFFAFCVALPGWTCNDSDRSLLRRTARRLFNDRGEPASPAASFPRCALSVPVVDLTVDLVVLVATSQSSTFAH